MGHLGIWDHRPFLGPLNHDHSQDHGTYVPTDSIGSLLIVREATSAGEEHSSVGKQPKCSQKMESSFPGALAFCASRCEQSPATEQQFCFSGTNLRGPLIITGNLCGPFPRPRVCEHGTIPGNFSVPFSFQFLSFGAPIHFFIHENPRNSGHFFGGQQVRMGEGEGDLSGILMNWGGGRGGEGDRANSYGG